jgi:hypothetical protein
MLIQRYYDGELESVEQAAYENHRRHCEACMILDARYASMFEALDAVPRYEPSVSFNRKVLAHVDIARYRVNPATRAVRAIGTAWIKVPVSVRVGGAVAAVFAMFVTGYRPFLDFIVSLGERTVTILASGFVLVKELIERSETLINYFTSVSNYRIAGEVLKKTLGRLVSEVPLPYLVLAAATVVVVTLIVVRTARVARNKGETNVRII